jgi:hypothetical protein
LRKCQQNCGERSWALFVDSKLKVGKTRQFCLGIDNAQAGDDHAAGRTTKSLLSSHRLTAKAALRLRLSVSGIERLSRGASWRREWRRLIWIEPHLERGEKCCCSGVITDQSDEIDQSAATKKL